MVYAMPMEEGVHPFQRLNCAHRWISMSPKAGVFSLAELTSGFASANSTSSTSTFLNYQPSQSQLPPANCQSSFPIINKQKDKIHCLIIVHLISIEPIHQLTVVSHTSNKLLENEFRWKRQSHDG